MRTRFATVLKLALAALVAPAPAAQAQDALIPYFRFSFGTIPKTVGVPAANTNTDPSTGLAVSVPCLTCTGRQGAYMSFEPAVYNVPPGNTATWFLASGTLPDGMDLSPATGVVFGTAGFSQPTKFVLGVQDDRQVPVYTPEITFQAFNAVSVAYASSSGRLQRTIDLAPQTSYVFGTPVYTLEAGYLPAGTTLDRGTGHITGTVGSSSFGIKVRATDSDGGFGISPPFDIATDAPQVIYPASPYGLRTGVAASEAPNIINMVQPYTAALTSGTLPPGLRLSQATGVIDGNPTQAGTWPNVVVTVTDSRGTVKSGDPLTFNVAQPSVTYASGSTRVSRFYAANPTPKALSAPQYYLTSGTLPAGMTLDQSSGAIQGYPTAVGTFSNLAVTAVDAGPATAVSPAFSITVANQPTATATNVAGRVNQQLSMQAQSSYFPTAPTWSLAGPPLPAGLGLNAATGLISGKVASTFSASGYILTATSGDLTAQTDQFSIAVAPPITANSPAIQVHNGMSKSATVTVFNSLADPSTLSLAPIGNVPSWLTTNGLTITAAPPANTGYTSATYSYRITDSDGSSATSSPNVSNIGPIMLTTAPAQGSYFAYTVGQTNNYTLAAYQNAIGAVNTELLQGGAPAPNALNACPGLVYNPKGVSNGATLSGQPTATCTVQNLSVRFTDADGSTVTTNTFSVYADARMTAAPPAQTRIPVGVAVTLPIQISGGRPPYYSYLNSGTAPPGLRFDNAQSAFVGTPTTVGTTSGLNVTAYDGNNHAVATGAFSITVANQLVISQPTPSTAVDAGTGAQKTMAITGGAAPYTTKLVQGTLPPQVTLSGQTLNIQNMTAGQAATGLVVQATDSSGQTDTTDPFDIVAVAPLAVPSSADSPAGPLNQPFRMAFTTTGGVAPYTFGWYGTSATNAAKGGFSISPDGVITGLSSTPSQAVVMVQVTDARGSTKYTPQFTVSIGGPIQVTTPQYIPMYYPNAGSMNLANTLGNGASPYVWSIAPGYTLPKSYTFYPADGRMSWTGYSNGWKGAFVITDAVGRTVTTDPIEFVAASKLTHTWPNQTRSSPTGKGGGLTAGGVSTVWDIVTYRVQTQSSNDNARPPYVGVTGGRGPYKFDFSGTTFPSDILTSIDSSAGKFYMTPRPGWSGSLGTSQLTITDTSGQTVTTRWGASQAAQPQIASCGAVYNIQTVVLNSCYFNAIYVNNGAKNLTQEGNWDIGKTPWQWLYSGGPAGIQVTDMGRNDGTGSICGVAPNSAIGSYDMLVQVTDPNGAKSNSCTVHINVVHN